MTESVATGVSNQSRRVVLASFVGTTIEYYDFFIYGLAAALVFRTQFFPEFSDLSGTLAAMGTFAVGFIARPIGGVVMGHFGDRVGRKTMLVIALMTMGVSTTLVGLLPTYESIGIWAPILLVTLRLIQGLGVGGEWAGAVLMAVENAPANKRAFYGSFPQLGLPAGVFLSQLVFLLLTSAMSPTAFAAWGWRIAFLMSAILIAVGLVIRLRLEESSEFERARSSEEIVKTPLLEVFRSYRAQIIVGSLGSVAAGAFGYLISLFLVQYSVSEMHTSTTTMLWVLTGVSALWVFMTLLGGYFADRVGRRPTFILGAVLAVVWAFPLFALVDTGIVAMIFIGLAGLALANSLMSGPLPALVTGMFPVSCRYSGSVVCYTFGSILGGGITPIVATALFGRYGSSVAISLLIIVIALVSAVPIVVARSKVFRQDGERVTDFVSPE
ncbi:MFS transporter [Rhodococcus sp. LB1]|uniref:MFS transporter n=1 Tax=Rhodococcus sp. LB1 TaxID=1807499 RepID=UPI00077A6C71|nr:MFS transporter [Rhodococcus sp. LB1]KXX54198.1 MFS transporter [Rhodococcus sp. LB1]